jgi:hypothetical protein
MSWDINDIGGVDYPLDLFGSLEPDDVLYEFDGPRIFISINGYGDKFLVYQCAEQESLCRYVVVPAAEELLQNLRTGLMTMRDALSQPWTWLVEKLHSGQVTRARKINIRDLPQNALPRPGTLLLPSLRPFLSLRMVGEKLGAGTVPASVIRRAVEGATTALKILVDWSLQTASVGGRPEDRLRRYYDLPTQRVAFASFEIAFAHPALTAQVDLLKEKEDARVLDKIGTLLQRGLEWASSPQEQPMPGSPESRVILEALSKLAPPRHGVVTEVHVGGTIAGQTTRPRVLTRSSSDRIRRTLDSTKTDIQPVKEEGFVREFDKDKLTFTLRDDDGNHIGRCNFTESLYDDALAAFDSEEMVTVLGYRSTTRDTIDILSIVRTPRPGTVT